MADENLFEFDYDLDFDLADFDIVGVGEESAPQENVRILKPRIGEDEITTKALYENAEEFARQIDLTPGSRTFAWVSGTFVFGDIIEALVTRRDVGIKKLYITTLSLSQENIDSLKNVMLYMGEDLERLVIIMSGYQYSHEKFGLVPYMYDQLDDGTNRTQIAFGRWHNKIITLETRLGHTITMHGSANLRSSNSVEQVMVEIDNRDLHDFNVGIMEHIAQHFGTINYNVEKTDLHYFQGWESWDLTKGKTHQRRSRNGKRKHRRTRTQS